MPSTVLANWTKMVVVAGGVGDIELAAVLGYPTLTQTAGLSTGVHYVILSVDGEPIETGIGQIEAGNIFARTEVLETFIEGVYSTSSPAAANIPAGATVHTAATAGLLKDLLSSVSPGKALLGHWPAESLTPRLSAGCAAVAFAETANMQNYGYLAFDAGVAEYAHFRFQAPKALDEAVGFTAVLLVAEAASATAHSSSWVVQALASGSGDTLSGAFSAPVQVSVSTASGLLTASAETPVIVPAGPWAAGDMIYVQVGRAAADLANDTLNVDALLLGVTLYATYAKATEG